MNNSLLVVLVFLLSATGCVGASVPAAKGFENLPHGEAIVLGQVKVLVNKVVASNDNTLENREHENLYFLICIVPESGGTFWYHAVTQKDDGAIYWQLPPGKYDIAAFEYRDQSSANNQMSRIIRPMNVRFTIPDGHQYVYIGALIITIKNKESLTTSSSYAFHVEDEYELARNSLKQKYPEARSNIVRQLMIIEKLH